ncbi:NAD-dependent succinate-semialdehyde dehydrogenase [Paenibacillus sp. GCM10012307]|uniref:NAD-dependent succinate-semialdehyde dehydrogenase n=1 Tax=Paenibacillus roseus TaxID=2798579 RepID=A0A934J3S6_9BACL|nr:NAD-dependent succinate-semialdehyde dehydrogenase [Paenibacillus roseus]MBJ6360978.1 NAD-dependent succinate-semialdehyde dehydrogenase [Paenibacillus roseus]
MNQWSMYMNGQWVQATSGERSEIINPADRSVVGTAAYGGAVDAERAIHAAAAAFKSWAALAAKERAAYLNRLAELLEQHKEELAGLITLEMGKPLAEARGEVAISAEYLRWNAGEAVRSYGKVIPSSSADKRLLSIRQPVGPVGAITPWNFPLSMAARKLGPALAAGCTIVLKPALQTPGAAVKFFELAALAGIPAGVMNLVTGDPKEIGDKLLSHPAIRKITFTGSTAVGKLLMKSAADHVKNVSMELGGHAPLIVFEDADLEQAVAGAMSSKFRNAGQTCICANRIYVQRSVADRFMEQFKEAVERLVAGDGRVEGTTIGPVIDEKSLRKIQFQVDDAISKGASVVTGGKRNERLSGYFFEPTILQDVNDTMTISQEETFGPVAPIYLFDTEEEVINQANHSVYGLAAYFYTKDLGRTIRVYEALEYGIVGCNDAVPTAVEGPFGGLKESGIGREGGPDSLADFLETKFVSIRI